MGDWMRTTSPAALVLFALGLVFLSAAPALAAARRGEPAHHGRAAAAASVRTVAHTPVRGGAQASVLSRSLPRIVGSARADTPASMRGQLAVSRDRHAAVATPACRRTAGRQARCASGPAMSWTRGLEPAAGVQASICPDGTMATPARGHETIIRCMPI